MCGYRLVPTDVLVYMFSVCLFVCLFLCVCTVTDLSAEDKASGVKFCTVVHRRPGQGISHLGNFAPPEALPEAQNRTNRPATSK